MKVAIVGSRNVTLSLNGELLPEGISEIVSGGAKGIDKCAEAYAKEKGIKLTVFLPEYQKYGRRAPIVRNRQIVDYSDEVFAFWDGASRGTGFVIEYCKKTGKRCTVILVDAVARAGGGVSI